MRQGCHDIKRTKTKTEKTMTRPENIRHIPPMLRRDLSLEYSRRRNCLLSTLFRERETSPQHQHTLAGVQGGIFCTLPPAHPKW